MNALVLVLGLGSLALAAGADNSTSTTSLCVWDGKLCSANENVTASMTGTPSPADSATMEAHTKACDDASEIIATTSSVGTKCKSAPAYCTDISGTYTPVNDDIFPKGVKITMTSCAPSDAKAKLLATSDFEMNCGGSSDLSSSSYKALSAKCQGMFVNAYGGTPDDLKNVSDWTVSVATKCATATSSDTCTSASKAAAALSPPPKLTPSTSGNIPAAIPSFLAAIALLLCLLAL